MYHTIPALVLSLDYTVGKQPFSMRIRNGFDENLHHFVLNSYRSYWYEHYKVLITTVIPFYHK